MKKRLSLLTFLLQNNIILTLIHPLNQEKSSIRFLEHMKYSRMSNRGKYTIQKWISAPQESLGVSGLDSILIDNEIMKILEQNQIEITHQQE